MLTESERISQIALSEQKSGSFKKAVVAANFFYSQGARVLQPEEKAVTCY